MLSTRRTKFYALVRHANEQPSQWLVATLMDATRNSGYMTALFGPSGPALLFKEPVMAKDLIYPKVVVLCTNSEGSPEFHTCAPAVTHEQMADGVHYDLAKDSAADNGYEEPMIAFDAADEAARQLTGLSTFFGRMEEAGEPKATHRCLVIVSGGVADYTCDPTVDVEVFDWDNFNVESLSGRLAMSLPPAFRDIAEPVGVPVATE